MGKSLDTAGLAAGRVALDANAKAVAKQFFDANFGKSSKEINVTGFDFTVDPSFRFVTLTATAEVPDALHARLRPGRDERRRPRGDRARDHRHGARAGARQHRLDVRRRLHLDAERRQRPRRHHLRRQEHRRQPLGQRRPLRLDREHRQDPHRLARHRRPGADQPRELLDRRLERLRHGPGHALRRRRHPGHLAEAHLLLLRRDLEHLRQQLAGDQDQHRRPEQGHHLRREHRARPEPRLRLADHLAHALQGDGEERAQGDGPGAPRRHHRQPRPDLGLAHALAALARALGRRAPRPSCRSPTRRR